MKESMGSKRIGSLFMNDNVYTIKKTNHNKIKWSFSLAGIYVCCKKKLSKSLATVRQIWTQLKDSYLKT